MRKGKTKQIVALEVRSILRDIIKLKSQSLSFSYFVSGASNVLEC